MGVENARHKLLIAGASGHGKVIAELARLLPDYNEIAFLDDADELIAEGKVLGNISYAVSHKQEYDAIVAIGNADIRKKIQEYYEKNGVNIATLIHPFSAVAQDVILGKGTVVMAGTVIQPGTRVGKGVIINTASSIDHDNEIGNYSHISIGSHLAGGVKIGTGTWIGAGATVSNNISICQNVMVGAGAVVVKDICEAGTYVGVPAERIR